MATARYVVAARPAGRRALVRAAPAGPGSLLRAARARRQLGRPLVARMQHRSAGPWQWLLQAWSALTGRQPPRQAACWLDADVLQALDDALADLAPQLPAPVLRQLADVKRSVARLAREPGAAEHLAPEDRMYVVECVRRYVPDALQAWLAVAPARRALPLVHGRSAGELLAAQLTFLQQQLEAREQRLAQVRAEALARNESFLRGKV